MRTIKELNEVVSLGEYAQDELNSIAESIYEFYLSEIERQKKEFQKEFPMFDDRITDLGSGRCSFYKYNIYGGELQLSDEERFRGETNTEYDTLPSTVFIDDKEENIIAGQAIGIDGIVCTDHCVVDQELKRLLIF